ncbi:MAG: stalk domain-containing protein [Dehalobacterium sp.]
MRNKTGWVMLISFLTLVFINSISFAAPRVIQMRVPVTYRGIQVLVDGEAIAGEEPFIMDKKGIVMVPVRTVAEAVGRSVEWDGTNNRVYISSAPYTAQTGSYNATPTQTTIKKVNFVTYKEIQIYAGEKIIAGEEPFILTAKGIVMVPLRSIAEATGKSVVWDGKKNTVEITSGSTGTGQPKSNNSNDFVRLEDMMVIRNVGPFFRQNGKPFTIAAGTHNHGLGVRLREGSAEIVIRTHGKYKAIEGWLGVDDETSNTSGAFFFSIFTDSKEVLSDVEVEGGAEKIINQTPKEYNYDYNLVEMENNNADAEDDADKTESIYKNTYPVHSDLYEKTPIFISGPILPASYPKYISPASTNISGALTVTIRVTWVAGEEGDYSDLTAVLADFKFIKE